MTAHIQPIPTMLGPAFIRTARVIRQISDRIYRVALEGPGEMTARLALPGVRRLHPDDTVLVAGESPASGYIIGLIESETSCAIRSTTGAGARIQGQETHQTITVHDADERVVFEYHPGTGRSVIHAPAGDLTLDAPNGFIGLRAGKGIRCTSAGEVAIKGKQGVRMTAAGKQDGPRTDPGFERRRCPAWGSWHNRHRRPGGFCRRTGRLSRPQARQPDRPGQDDLRQARDYGPTDVAAKRSFLQTGSAPVPDPGRPNAHPGSRCPAHPEPAHHPHRPGGCAHRRSKNQSWIKKAKGDPDVPRIDPTRW